MKKKAAFCQRSGAQVLLQLLGTHTNEHRDISTHIQAPWCSMTGFSIMQRDNNASMAMGYIWLDREK